MDQYLVFIHLYFWNLAEKWWFFLSDVSVFSYHTLRYQTMRLFLSCAITGPDKIDACMRMILSSVPLLMHQSSRISTFPFPKIRQQCNESLRYTVFAFHQISSFLFRVECLFQLEQVVPLVRDSIDRHNPLLQTLRYKVQRTPLHWENQSFSTFPSCINSPFCSPLSYLLELRNVHILETSTFFLTGFEVLQIWIKLISCEESCRNRLTQWVRVNLARISH